MLTNSFGTTHTLVLQNLTLSSGYRLGRFTGVVANGSATFGQLDFYRARRLLNPEQATIFTIPENSIVSYASAQAYVGLVQQMSTFNRLELGGLAGHTGPAPGQRSFSFFRTQASVGGVARVTHQLTPRNSLGVEGEYRQIWFQGGPYYTALTPSMIFERRVDTRYTLNVRAGLLLSGTTWGSRQIPEWEIGSGLLPPRTGTEHRYLPVFGVTAGGFGVRGPGFSYTARGSFNLLPFYDPVQGVLQQRVAVGMGNTFILSRKYLARCDLQVYVPGHLEFSHTKQPYINQDVFAILNPVLVRRFDRYTTAEAGALITQRLADYTQVFGHWYRPELILYIAFTGSTIVW
jgi:hypothetical protein